MTTPQPHSQISTTMPKRKSLHHWVKTKRCLCTSILANGDRCFYDAVFECNRNHGYVMWGKRECNEARCVVHSPRNKIKTIKVKKPG